MERSNRQGAKYANIWRVNAVIVTYFVKKDHEAQFERILRKHWRVLRSENLTTDQLPFLLKDPESPGVYKEIFEWKSKRSFQMAHESESVRKIWRKMKELTEDGGIEPVRFRRI